MTFESKFDLGELVSITESGEEGTVIGTAFYPVDEDRYLIRYKNGSGNAVENWWPESALVAA